MKNFAKKQALPTERDNSSLQDENLRNCIRFYLRLRWVVRPFLMAYFKPLILNRENLTNADCAIIAPNHVTTLDPFVLFSNIERFVRWGALKRFFDAEDSIFNNNKNHLLKQFTAWLLRKMGTVPIDREKDNWAIFKELHRSTKAGVWVGLFPEGTTNKNPDTVVVQEPKSAVFLISKSTNAFIQPIAITWATQKEKGEIRSRYRLAINYRPSFVVEDPQSAAELWMQRIREGIFENLAALGVKRDYHEDRL